MKVSGSPVTAPYWLPLKASSSSLPTAITPMNWPMPCTPKCSSLSAISSSNSACCGWRWTASFSIPPSNPSLAVNSYSPGAVLRPFLSPSIPPTSRLLPMNSKLPSCCSMAYSMNNSADCLPGWSPSAWATAGTLCSAISWAWMYIPWPAVGSNCWIRMWSAADLAAPAGAYSDGKKTPDLIAVLHCLLEHDTAGDPMTGLRWSRRTTSTIAEELAKLGIAVSPNTVARLLHDMGYSLRVNQKQISTSSSPNRNLQFEYLAELRDRFQRRHLPIVSVDSKKRELVGNFKNPGRRWESAPRCVYDHDFRTDSIGVAIPYGIYDVMENRGALVVGVSH